MHVGISLLFWSVFSCVRMQLNAPPALCQTRLCQTKLRQQVLVMGYKCCACVCVSKVNSNYFAAAATLLLSVILKPCNHTPILHSSYFSSFFPLNFSSFFLFFFTGTHSSSSIYLTFLLLSSASSHLCCILKK